jgi:hypothetical protein
MLRRLGLLAALAGAGVGLLSGDGGFVLDVHATTSIWSSAISTTPPVSIP